MTNSFLNLPAPFRQRLERIVPAQHLARVQESFCQARLPSFRINTLKATVDEVLQELQTSDIICHRFSWLNEACWVALEDRSRLTHHHLAESGAIYLHNISSMFASAATDALPDQTVLDLAAAPGGKTLHIAAMMNGTGMMKGTFKQVITAKPTANTQRNRQTICEEQYSEGRVSCAVMMQ